MKYSLGDNIDHEFEVEMMNRAADNVGSENIMRKELSDISYEFLQHQVWLTRQYVPSLPADIQSKLISLAQFGARCRGTVSRDKYHSDIMTSKPAAEYGTRLVKQLVKFCKALCYLGNKKLIGSHEYDMAKKVMLDTIPQRIEDIVRCLYFNCPTINDTLRTKDVAAKTKYTVGTISHVLADLDILGVVTKTGKQNIYEWTLSKYIRDLIEKAEIYK